MVPEYVAQIAAQRVKEFAARAADPGAGARTGDSRFVGTRAGLSTALRRLADRVDPAPRPANQGGRFIASTAGPGGIRE